jgi:hypothetical protein
MHLKSFSKNMRLLQMEGTKTCEEERVVVEEKSNQPMVNYFD